MFYYKPLLASRQNLYLIMAIVVSQVNLKLLEHIFQSSLVISHISTEICDYTQERLLLTSQKDISLIW